VRSMLMLAWADDRPDLSSPHWRGIPGEWQRVHTRRSRPRVGGAEAGIEAGAASGRIGAEIDDLPPARPPGNRTICAHMYRQDHCSSCAPIRR
jgi:hypothetical protein